MPSDKDYIHLNVYSTYSILESLLKIDRLLQKTSESGMSSVALTDHNSVCGMSEFKSKAVSARIKAIYGCDINLKSTINDAHSRILLIASTEKGWHNLIKIHNHAWRHYEGEPVTTFDYIKKNKDGLICLEGGPDSELMKVMEDEDGDFERYTDTMKGVFGDNLYLIALDVSGDKLIADLNKRIFRSKMKYIISNRILYEEEGDFKTHNILNLIRHKKTLKDVEKGSVTINVCNDYYFKTPEQIKKNYSESEWYGCLESCREIGEKIREIPILDKPHLPKIVGNAKRTILDIIKKNFKKIPPEHKDIYFKRIKQEMGVYEKTNSLDYLLIVRDFLKWADENGYLRNFGRGSACSSLVTYLLEIHYVDPVKVDLFFERFLNENRGIKMKVF